MEALMKKWMHVFERVIVATLMILLAVMVVLGTIMLVTLLVHSLGTRLALVTDAAALQDLMQKGFGAVLVVLLGLELLETIRQYDAEHHVRVEVVFFIGLIALGRHVIQVDYAHAPMGELLGVAAIVIALSTGYFLVRKGSQIGRDDGAKGAKH